MVDVKINCLKQDRTTFTQKCSNFITYELDAWLRDLNTKFTLCDCSFGAVKSTKNYGPDKNGFSGYGKKICKDLHHNGASHFSYGNGVKIQQFLTKDSEIKPYQFCLVNISKKFSVNHFKNSC